MKGNIEIDHEIVFWDRFVFGTTCNELPPHSFVVKGCFKLQGMKTRMLVITIGRTTSSNVLNMELKFPRLLICFHGKLNLNKRPKACLLFRGWVEPDWWMAQSRIIKAVSSSIWSSPFLGMVNVHIFVWKGEIEANLQDRKKKKITKVSGHRC